LAARLLPALYSPHRPELWATRFDGRSRGDEAFRGRGRRPVVAEATHVGERAVSSLCRITSPPGASPPARASPPLRNRGYIEAKSAAKARVTRRSRVQEPALPAHSLGRRVVGRRPPANRPNGLWTARTPEERVVSSWLRCGGSHYVRVGSGRTWGLRLPAGTDPDPTRNRSGASGASPYRPQLRGRRRRENGRGLRPAVALAQDGAEAVGE
jgi:hypothetical protein